MIICIISVSTSSSSSLREGHLPSQCNIAPLKSTLEIPALYTRDPVPDYTMLEGQSFPGTERIHLLPSSTFRGCFYFLMLSTEDIQEWAQTFFIGSVYRDITFAEDLTSM